MANRGLGSRRGERKRHGERLPPGQSLTTGFPVLTSGAAPQVSTADWKLVLKVGPRPVSGWSWDEFNALPQSELVADIHCVTTWSKFDTRWRGVMMDDLLIAAGLEAPTRWVLAHSAGGYSTNVPAADLLGGKAMVATRFDGEPLADAHGGPARLVVPHLYFWKSAKWLEGLQFTQQDEPGFWESRGYHMRGNPFNEERYG